MLIKGYTCIDTNNLKKTKYLLKPRILDVMWKVSLKIMSLKISNELLKQQNTEIPFFK